MSSKKSQTAKSHYKQNKAKTAIEKQKVLKNKTEYVFKYEENKIFKQKLDLLNLNKSEPLSQEAQHELEKYKQKLKNENIDIFQFQDEQEDQEHEGQNDRRGQKLRRQSSTPNTASQKEDGVSPVEISTDIDLQKVSGVVMPMELVNFDEESEEQQVSESQENLQNSGNLINRLRQEQVKYDTQQQSSEISFRSSSHDFQIQPISSHSDLISPNQTLDQSQLEDSACVFLKKKTIKAHKQQPLQELQILPQKKFKIHQIYDQHQNPFEQQEEEQIQEELKGIKINSIALGEDVSIQILDKELFVLSKIPPGIIVKCKLKRASGFFNIVSPQFDLYLENGLKHLVSVKKNSFRNRQLFLFSTKIGNFNSPQRILMANVLHNSYWLVHEPKIINKKKIAYLDTLVEYSPVKHQETDSQARNMTVLIPPTLKSYHIGLDYETPHIDFAWFRKNVALQLHNSQDETLSKKSSPKNFSLVDDEDEDYIYLKMEKESENIFDVQIQHPLTPMQAIAIIMTRFDAQLK